MKRIAVVSSVVLASLVFVFTLWPQQAADEFFGVQVGGDRVLIPYPRIVDYFHHLEKNSPRVKLRIEGRTTQGNEMVLAVISAESNIRNLDRLIAINKRLADPGGIGAEEARSLEGQAKVFVLITASIHASEIGASQMALKFAHRLATTRDPRLCEELEQAVVLLMPSINPDGQIMICDWYQKYLGTPYEGGAMPYLYHHYAGHDNNRDYFMLNLKESSVLNAVLHHRYFPHVFLDMHQMGGSGPRIFVPPFQDPFNLNLSPLMLREVELIGAAMALRLQEAGKKGVANGYGFDAYWPGGTKNTAWYKNVVGLLTELASVRTATPIHVDPSDLRGGGKGLMEYKPQVNFPDPWPGGWWRLSDIIDYELIACEALVETAAKNRETFVANFCRMGLENIRRGQSEVPYAYVVPRQQWDAPEAFAFLRKMQEHGVRISRLRADWIAGGRVQERGSYVIPLAQPYRPFIKAMLERQRYPEIRLSPGAPILEPYDATGWTLPLLMNVRVEALEAPLAGAPLEEVTSLEYPEPAPAGTGEFFLLPGRFNKTFLVVNRLLKQGIRVYRAQSDGTCRAGDFLVATATVSGNVLKEAIRGADLEPERVSLAGKQPQPPQFAAVALPRLAIYQSYLASADEGWTRWILDAFEFPYQVLHNSDFADKQFAQKYDVILFPSQSRNAIVDGKSSAERPAPFLPKEYQGGIGKDGVEALKTMVKRGGRVILFDAAWEVAQKDFELPLANVLGGSAAVKFDCPGSILRIKLENGDPLAWGLEPDAGLFFSRSAAFRAGSPDDQSSQRFVVGRFASEGPHLLSGYLEGGELLDNAVAAVRYQVAKGQVVIFGGRIQYRAWTTGTFKLLFNALFLPTPALPQ